MPQSLLGSLPVCHQHFFQAAFLTYILVLTATVKRGLESTCFHTLTSIYLNLGWAVQPMLWLCFKSSKKKNTPDLFSCQTWRGHGSVKRARTDLGDTGCDETQRKHTNSQQTGSAPSPEPTLYTCIQALRINTTHSLAHEALATWYLNLPPGREWKMCHRCYLLHSHEQRWLTAGWIAPLCSMMQCNVVGGWGGRGACGHLFTVVCIGGSGVGARWNHSAR